MGCFNALFFYPFLAFDLYQSGGINNEASSHLFFSLLVMVGCNLDKSSMPASFSPIPNPNQDGHSDDNETNTEVPVGPPTSNLVTYTIVNGHGSAPWGSLSNPIRGVVGQVLRIINNDSSNHQIHTAGNPFNHTEGIGSNTMMDFTLLRPITTTSITPSTYEHNFGPSSPIYFAVTAAVAP